MIFLFTYIYNIYIIFHFIPLCTFWLISELPVSPIELLWLGIGEILRTKPTEPNRAERGGEGSFLPRPSDDAVRMAGNKTALLNRFLDPLGAFHGGYSRSDFTSS